MLVALAVTAATRALTALTGVMPVGWRLIGPGIATPFGAGLMIPFSALADRPATRREGLFGMGLIVVEFAGMLGII
jgi:hypothetical protein